MILEDLEKICLILYKNDSNLSDYWLLIIDSKIKANQAKYDLDRLTAKISALSSGELSKYEYLTGEDLGYRPSVLEQKNLIILHWAKFLVRDWMIKMTKKKEFWGDWKILKIIKMPIIMTKTKKWRQWTK